MKIRLIRDILSTLFLIIGLRYSILYSNLKEQNEYLFNSYENVVNLLSEQGQSCRLVHNRNRYIEEELIYHRHQSDVLLAASQMNMVPYYKNQVINEMSKAYINFTSKIAHNKELCDTLVTWKEKRSTTQHYRKITEQCTTSFLTAWTREALSGTPL